MKQGRWPFEFMGEAEALLGALALLSHGKQDSIEPADHLNGQEHVDSQNINDNVSCH